ncbi:glycosyltransferase family 2 protein [Candidatus Uhrbacteria bacterium]|nr:glycosyltransferase family 2 protein [Candidatus Uhrbacteria bacterium]
MRVLIIIPMYNEQRLAQESIATILPYVQELPTPTTVLVVNDGSRDQTKNIVEECIAQQQDPQQLVMVSHECNQGYGAALRTGMRYAANQGYDYALFMDSDLTNHPKYLHLFYPPMVYGIEYIKATRYRPGGGMEGVAWQRQLFSRVGNCLGRNLLRLPLSDVTNGFRAVKVDILAKLTLHENGFPIIMEELAQAKKFVRSYAEVPYILTERTATQGATHFPYSMKTIATYLYYAFIGFFYARPK